MHEYFHIMENAPEEARFLLDSMFIRVKDKYNNDIAKAWSVLHPNVMWVRTLIVDSPLMDALSPPEVHLGERWEFAKFLRSVQRLARNKSIGEQNVSGLLSDLWPSLLREKDSQADWTDETADRLEKELELPKGTLHRLAKKARRSLAFVTLGCCMRLDGSRLELLRDHFKNEVLQGLFSDSVVCIIDCQRIWYRGINLLRRDELNFSPLVRKKVAAEMLGWIVWLHEQSHATRGTGGAPEEEVEAQLETYRMCDHTRFKSFCVFGLPGYPNYRQIMKRLALRQPAPYRAIFTKAFQSALR